jgi:hypothetical protein
MNSIVLCLIFIEIPFQLTLSQSFLISSLVDSINYYLLFGTLTFWRFPCDPEAEKQRVTNDMFK